MQSAGTERPAVGLTIAGFDPSSGAGVTADLKTFAAHGIFGTSAITALTVQSTRRVCSVEPVDENLLATTLDELESDLPPAGIKIGMLARAPLVEVVGDYMRLLRTVRPQAPIVLDPVIRASSGRSLLSESGIAAMRERLLPHVTAVTPNWSELAILSQRTVDDPVSARTAAEALGRRYPGLAVVATGGDAAQPVDGLLLADGRWIEFFGEHVETTSTHGTGCAFSSAMLCALMQGQSMEDAVASAKAFVTEALRRAPGLGSGKGPMDLLWPLHGTAGAMR